MDKSKELPTNQKTKLPGKKILAFLRYAIDPEHFEAPAMSDEDWRRLYRFAFRQTILGVVFEGINRYNLQDSTLPQNITSEWILKTLKIERQNKLTNNATAKICQLMEDNGFKCCILKGQGNNLLYPNPYSRTPGDIDLWVVQKENGSRNIRNIIKFVRLHNPEGRAVYHHIDYGLFNNIDVEVHYRPSFLNNPIYNHRLQKWFLQQAETQFSNRVALPNDAGTIVAPTQEFNAIFQLVHIYTHLLNRGIGMRQIIDYYYVMKGLKKKQELDFYLRYLGLEKIAGAVMWVLTNLLGMEENYLIAAPNEKLGHVLTKEILKGGNFGRYGKDHRKLFDAKSKSKYHFWIEKNFQRLIFDLRMLRYFPTECLCEPLFRIYHFFWRCFYGSHT